MSAPQINAVRAMRLAAKLTQKALAQRMGCSQAYVGQIEKPGFHATDALIAKVKNALAGGLAVPRAKAPKKKEAPPASPSLQDLWPARNPRK